MDRRVFIVWVHPLFCETVRLLLEHPGIEIVGNSADFDAALEEINQLKPDTVIVEETEDQTETHSGAIQILQACLWGLRVLRMSMQDNELWVYSHERRNINSSDEFIRIVHEPK